MLEKADAPRRRMYLAPLLTRKRCRKESVCPLCGAQRGERCFRRSKDGRLVIQKDQNHQERVMAAWATGKFRSPRYPMGYRNSDDYRRNVAAGEHGSLWP